MPQPLFGTGVLTITPVSSGTVTPTVVAVLKDISVDVSYQKKDLIGNLQFPVDSAKGQGQITGKAKSGYFAGGLISAILSGSTTTTGSKVGVFSEQGTVPTTPFQITVSGSATWLSDLGVYDVTAGKFLSRVAAGPASGQYSVAAGVYTFAAADTGHIVQISYDKTMSAVGTTVTLTNQLMGTNSGFGMKLYNNYAAVNAVGGVPNSAGIYLPMVVIPKLSFAFKNADFFEKSIDFEALADSAGNVMYAYTGTNP